jgi:hypothetical protein
MWVPKWATQETGESEFPSIHATTPHLPTDVAGQGLMISGEAGTNYYVETANQSNW